MNLKLQWALVVPWTRTSGRPLAAPPVRDPRSVARPHMLEDGGSFSHGLTLQSLRPLSVLRIGVSSDSWRRLAHLSRRGTGG